MHPAKAALQMRSRHSSFIAAQQHVSLSSYIVPAELKTGRQQVEGQLLYLL